MATVKDDLANWTLDDLLEAINPAPPSVEERQRRALVVVIKSWEAGEITDEQASGLIEVIVTAPQKRRVNEMFNEMVNDLFTPKRRRKGARRFSLI